MGDPIADRALAKFRSIAAPEAEQIRAFNDTMTWAHINLPSSRLTWQTEEISEAGWGGGIRRPTTQEGPNP